MTPLVNGRIISTDTRISAYLAVKELRGLPVLSRSDLLAVLECPSKFHKCAVEPDEQTWEKDFGSLVDCKITQPKLLGDYFIQPPDTYQPERKGVPIKGDPKEWDYHSKTCRSWRDAQRAKGIITAEKKDFDAADMAVESLMTHPKHGQQTQRLITQSLKQVFVVAEYHDQKTGVKVAVKALHDLLPAWDSEFGTSIFDIKTIASAVPHKWRESVFNFNWHVQAAMALDVYNAGANPKEQRDTFRHIIIENTPPYECAFRWLTEEFIEMGREKYLSGLQRYCECVKSGDWPGYHDEYAQVMPDRYESCAPTPRMVEHGPLARRDDPEWLREPIHPETSEARK